MKEIASKSKKECSRDTSEGIPASFRPTRDIQVVSGGGYIEGSFTLLRLSGERADAALFFAGLIDSHARGAAVDVARWYLRAAVSEFRSVFDLLPADLRQYDISNKWARSQFKQELDAHILVSILKKIRNFTVHSRHVRGVDRAFSLIVLSEGAEHQESIPSIFIEPLNRQAHGREIASVSDEELTWFNRQTTIWPAHLLIQEAIYQTSILLRNFLVVSQSHTKLRNNAKGIDYV